MTTSEVGSAISNRTSLFVWGLVPLVVLALLGFAIQPAASLVDTGWLRALHLRTAEVTPALRAMVFVAFLIAYSPIVWALVRLGGLARAYASGRVFVDQAARCLSSAAWALIFAPLAILATMVALQLVLTELGMVAHDSVAISVQIEWFVIGAIGLVLRLVALAMRRAVVIAKEHSEYV